jgi:glycosyltransferase involved in cell wall biosynthesis
VAASRYQKQAMKDHLDRVSLVVPLRDEERSVAELIRSLVAQTRPPDEVVLVDGGSTDATMELAREITKGDPRFRIIEAGPATPGRGRNVGIEAATHEWIALTDAGIRLEPDWLERLVEVANRDPQVDVVYGNYEPVLGSWFERCAALVYVPPKQCRPGGRMRGPSIASALLRRSVWSQVGGFPDLRAAEDLIFMEKIDPMGFKIGWAPQATVHWRIQPSLSRTFRKFVLYSKHNVWADRQRYWHYGVARQYLMVLPFLALAVLINAWWLCVPIAWLLLRVARNIFVRREEHGLIWMLNPLRFAGVAGILLTIDLATFVGWAQALLNRPARRDPAAAEAALPH